MPIQLEVVTDSPKPLIDHLEELRRRFCVVLGAAAILSFAGYLFVDPIIHGLAKATGGFVFTKVAEAFTVRIKIAAILGGMATLPVILYELWRFVGVTLSPVLRRRIFVILPASYALFVCGVSVAWFVVLPAAVRFLVGYATPDLKPLLSLDSFVGFAAGLSIMLGFLFQLPLATFFLVNVGFVEASTLAGYRRHVIVGLAILAAVISPGPDPISQLIVLIPTYALYEVSIWIGLLTARRLL